MVTMTQNKALFRKNINSDETKSACWLAKVKELALWYSTFNDVPEFSGLKKQDLIQIAQLSKDNNNILKLEEILAGYGVILVIENSIAGSKLDGVVYLNEKNQAVVGLTLRFKRVDYFWFTLLHELSHLCLHASELDSPIMEHLDEPSESLIEMEADSLALNSFVPYKAWRNCEPKYNCSENAVVKFANEMGIHPAIVAGRIHRERNQYNLFSKIVNEIDVRELLKL
jgi:HTH-type transcriptional regulator/antitoxin HigA